MRLFTLLTLVVFISIQAHSQSEWKSAVSKKGVTVKYKVSKIDGKQVVEYKAMKTATVAYQNCISVLKDASIHKDFIQYAEVSKLVKAIAANEWVIYYAMDPPWPMPNSDSVSKMKLSENKSTKTALFDCVSVPDMYPMQDVKRMIHNEGKYIFKDKGNGEVQIILVAKFTPVAEAPDWMMNAWFPEGPADMVTGIVELAE